MVPRLQCAAILVISSAGAARVLQLWDHTFVYKCGFTVLVADKKQPGEMRCWHPRLGFWQA
jgi:hypothetical protein